MIKLNSGAKLPSVGLGTFQIKDAQIVKEAMEAAVESGYRLIDTASVYKNEVSIGICLKNLLEVYNLKRDDFFVTTKLGPKDLGKNSVTQALETSLSNLQLDYIDLYLIHWPGKQGIKHDDKRNKSYRKETWLELERIYKNTDKIKSLGVSNYSVAHLTELMDYATIIPAVLQSEFHPDYQDSSAIDFCHKHNIHFQAYSSLGQSRLVEDERFKLISLKYEKTIAQLLLRWCLQNGCSIIPKSKNPRHIKENIDIFDFKISSDDMALISKLGRNVKYAWNPDQIV